MKKKQSQLKKIIPYLFISPAFLLMLFLLFIPLLSVIILSFTNWQLGAKSLSFVGIKNYLHLFKDEIFFKSALNTFLYTLIVVPGSVFLGLGAALLIQSQRSLQNFYRTVYFLPVMSTFVAMVIVWEYLLHPSFGFYNSILTALGFSRIDFLRDEKIVLLTLSVIGVWQLLGFNMVLFMAGLSRISSELYQASQVDGADNSFEQFRLVTWPQLSPITLFVVVITSIRSFQVFESVHVLTQGGPNHASEVMIFTMYEEGFHFFRTGYASAITVIFMIVVLLITIVKNFWMERKIFYS